MFIPTPEQIIDILQRSQDGYSTRAITEHYGFVANQAEYHVIYNLTHSKRPFVNVRQPRRWRPSCMSAKEYDDWRSMMETMTDRNMRVARPCEDCDIKWARERRAEGRCNGTLPEERADTVRAGNAAQVRVVSGTWRAPAVGAADHP